MLSFEQKKYNLSDAELRELRDEMGSRGYDDIVDQARDLPPDRMPRYGDLGGGSSMFDDFMDDLRRISKEQDQFEISGTEPRGILPDRAVLDELQELDNLMGQSDSPLSARQINQRRAAIMDDFYTKNPQLAASSPAGAVVDQIRSVTRLGKIPLAMSILRLVFAAQRKPRFKRLLSRAGSVTQQSLIYLKRTCVGWLS